MIVGRQTIETATDLVGSLLSMHQDDIDKAFLSAEGQFSISLKIIMKPSDNGGIDVDAGISFVTDRVKDSVMRNVQEGQEGLFNGETETAL